MSHSTHANATALGLGKADNILRHLKHVLCDQLQPPEAVAKELATLLVNTHHTD
jgi:hypothetical protein